MIYLGAYERVKDGMFLLATLSPRCLCVIKKETNGHWKTDQMVYQLERSSLHVCLCHGAYVTLVVLP